ncbi:STAS domain-containing protein [Catalinimonas niigatensis]|uniref:STAS domain-containing protein n=1 Tax=Catalinimonas niigatensis TaxID=1397264 RepID=UPI0026665E40|nr:STAS domain-containing protein [Catalinimonas niigatensis]WPP53538.1 STAS domain-containing protein [Catalinimonas niigatensis]
MQTTEYIQLTTKGPEAGILKLSGDLTVKHIQELKENILKAIGTFKQLEILINHPETIDIAFFQLIEAAQQRARKSKKKLTLTYKISDDVHELCRKAGLTLENQ